MTEIDKNITETTHTETSVDLSGSDNGRSWKLHALEHYAESDKKLSDEYMEDIAKSLKRYGIKDCLIRVTDGYNYEGDDQHYRFEVRFGSDENMVLSKAIQKSVNYEATADDVPEPFNGSINVTVYLPSDTAENVCVDMTQEAYDKYNELVGTNYPDWETTFTGEPVMKAISI
jgi:hypothetical protein